MSEIGGGKWTATKRGECEPGEEVTLKGTYI